MIVRCQTAARPKEDPALSLPDLQQLQATTSGCIHGVKLCDFTGVYSTSFFLM